jgi:hydroxyacylglutathione hydrolase
MLSRPFEVSGSVRWWPSALFQTTTLEVVRDSARLLVDPGVAPWEIGEVAGDGDADVLITHADWDHVLGIGILESARITASRAAAERLRAPGAGEEIERQAAEYYVPCEHLELLRVDRAVEPPAEIQIGPWSAVCRATPGHTSDGMAISIPEEGLLVVGDYLSELEIPFVNSSAPDYERTLELLVQVIEDERPEHVVVGHGPPHAARRALELAEEDLAYVRALRSHVAGGGSLEDAAAVPHPRRDVVGDAEAHRQNVANVLRTGG